MWFCYCGICNAACATQDGSYSISQVKKLFVQTLDSAMMAKVDHLYASWATHSIALDWVGKEQMDGKDNRTAVNSMKNKTMYSDGPAHVSRGGITDNLTHTIPDRLKTTSIFRMGTLDKEMVQIQMRQLHVTVASRSSSVQAPQLCPTE